MNSSPPRGNDPRDSRTPTTPCPPSRAHSAVIRPMAVWRAWYMACTSGPKGPGLSCPGTWVAAGPSIPPPEDPPAAGQRGASKAAEWSLTNGVRLELHHQGTLVVAVHAGFIDTDMAALVDAPKISPESVARQAFDAVEAGQVEVLADERTRTVKASLSRDHELIYPPVQEFWDEAVKGTS